MFNAGDGRWSTKFGSHDALYQGSQIVKEMELYMRDRWRISYCIAYVPLWTVFFCEVVAGLIFSKTTRLAIRCVLSGVAIGSN